MEQEDYGASYSGMSKVMSSFLDNGDGTSVQIDPIPESKVGMKYSELFDYYKKEKHILLLGILENMGVTSSQHGAGHYISLNFDEPMTQMLSLIYTMKGMGRDDLTQFRYCLEREAMHLAVDYASEQQKILIGRHLEALLSAETEKDRYEHDMALHMTLIEASRNDYLITTYRALTNVIESYIPVFRGKIIEGMKSSDMLEETHRMLVMGVMNSDLQTGLEGLSRHFEYIRQFRDLQ